METLIWGGTTSFSFKVSLNQKPSITKKNEIKSAIDTRCIFKKKKIKATEAHLLNEIFQFHSSDYSQWGKQKAFLTI